MPQNPPRWWRVHPILSAAMLGALVGLLNAVFIELEGVNHHDRHGSVLAFGPGSFFGQGMSEAALVQTGAFLFIEFAANIVVLALLFAAPVAAVVGIRRLLRRRRSGGAPPTRTVE